MPNTSSIYILRRDLTSLEEKTKIFSEAHLQKNARMDEDESNQLDRLRLEFEDNESGIKFSNDICVYEFDFVISKERNAMIDLLNDLSVEYAT